MAQLLSALAARGRAVDEGQLEILLTKVFALSQQYMTATLGHYMAAKSKSSGSPIAAAALDGYAAESSSGSSSGSGGTSRSVLSAEGAHTDIGSGHAGSAAASAEGANRDRGNGRTGSAAAAAVGVSAREALLLLKALAAVRARPPAQWAQAAADLLGLRLQLGQLSKVGLLGKSFAGVGKQEL